MIQLVIRGECGSPQVRATLRGTDFQHKISEEFGMRKWGVLLYGVFCYLCFFGTFLYMAAWLANLIPRSIDAPATEPWQATWYINILCIVNKV